MMRFGSAVQTKGVGLVDEAVDGGLALAARLMESYVDGLLRDKAPPSRIPPLGAPVAERVITLTRTTDLSAEATHWAGGAMAKSAGSVSLRCSGFGGRIAYNPRTFACYRTWPSQARRSDPIKALRETRLTYLNNPNPVLRDPRVWAPYVLIE